MKGLEGVVCGWVQTIRTLERTKQIRGGKSNENIFLKKNESISYCRWGFFKPHLTSNRYDFLKSWCFYTGTIFQIFSNSNKVTAVIHLRNLW